MNDYCCLSLLVFRLKKHPEKLKEVAEIVNCTILVLIYNNNVGDLQYTHLSRDQQEHVLILFVERM